MVNLRDIIQSLKGVDWNFPGSGTEVGSVHGLHWFAGNFIPQIPAFLIQALSKPGDLVLDPFSGSGTTAVEAIRLGRDAIVADVVTACVFITAGKLAIAEEGISSTVRADVSAHLVWDALLSTNDVGDAGEGAHPDLGHWFSPKTLGQLRYIWKEIETYDGNTRRGLELLFADTLFACASPGTQLTSAGKIRRHHWGWVADNVRPRQLQDHDAVLAFQRRLLQLSPLRLEKRKGVAAVLKQDASAMALGDSTVDLIVTSPPYLGVIDYTRANRLLYLWMGWPLDADRKAEIGARYRREAGNVVGEYLSKMNEVWNESARALKTGGFCAVVLGESRKFPGTCDKAISGLNSRMPIVWGPMRRTPTRRRVADRLNRESFEFIVVCQKQ